MTGRSGSQGSESGPNRPGDAAESVPGYRDLARIGHGGFSVVYRAVQESFERSVALKVLSVGPDEDARRRFLREVRLASRLSGHPHVVTVLDTGTTDSGRPYLAMDLYDGGSMKQRLTRSGPLSPAETAMVGAKIADALAAAHSLGVLHRDVKPNNILVSRFGEPALADFGVSCLLDSSSSASVLDVFSPQHAAPELMTRGVPSKSSDVYALGSTLYELLTGRPPFDGDNRDVRSVIWRALSEPAPRPECPELPELADVIVRALAKEPEERFPDAVEFARTLRALIPDGTAATLVLTDLPPAIGAAAVPAAAESVAAESGTRTEADSSGSWPDSVDWPDIDDDWPAEPSLEPDATSTGRARGADETMVRPDRADPSDLKQDSAARGGIRLGRNSGSPGGTGGGVTGNGGAENDDDRSGAHRARKPLIIAAVIVLLGGATWALLASQNPSTAANDDAAGHRTQPTVSADAAPVHSSARATPSPSAKPKHSATASAGETKAAGAPSHVATSASASDSTAPLLTLPGSYNRIRNAQSGDCLSNPSGSSATQSACASSRSEGWQYSVPLTGLLTAPVSGEFELVDEQSGDCLTAGSGGQVSVSNCDGDASQLWTKAASSGSGTEFRNVGAAQCLSAEQSSVADGSCSTGNQADLWNEDGTV